METNEKILLYWSGEADESLTREVESLLDADTSARAYLEELNDLGATLRDVEAPSARSGLLEEVLDERDDGPKLIHFPAQWLWVAAVLSILAVGLSLVFRPGSESVTPIVVHASVSTSSTAAKPKVKKPKLSQRLLSRSGSFRGGDRLRQSHRQRSRWQTFKTTPPTT